MHNSPGACFDYQLKKCNGVCTGKEDAVTYNLKVEMALQSLQNNKTKIIVDEGREYNEKSVVLIENGIYKGFGYFDSAIEIDTAEKAREVIKPYRHNADVQRILSGLLMQ